MFNDEKIEVNPNSHPSTDRHPTAELLPEQVRPFPGQQQVQEEHPVALMELLPLVAVLHSVVPLEPGFVVASVGRPVAGCSWCNLGHRGLVLLLDLGPFFHQGHGHHGL